MRVVELLVVCVGGAFCEWFGGGLRALAGVYYM